MKGTAMFVAGAMLALAAFGAAPNSEQEERYRAKYGRHTEAYEKREKSPAKVEAPECCRKVNASFKNEPRETFAEALLRGKYGRSMPGAEAQEKLAGRGPETHERDIHVASANLTCGHDCCRRSD